MAENKQAKIPCVPDDRQPTIEEYIAGAGLKGHLPIPLWDVRGDVLAYTADEIAEIKARFNG